MSGMPEKWEVNVLGRAPSPPHHSPLPNPVQLSLEAEAAASGDICFLTLQPGSPRPLSPGLRGYFTNTGGGRARGGRKRVDGSSGDLPTPPRPLLFSSHLLTFKVKTL